MLKSIKNFKVSYPYPLEYPIKVVVDNFNIRAMVGWLYQKFSLPIAEKELQISERIVELPLTHSWLGRIFDTGNRGRILEIGHVASQLSLELASLGHQVEAIDLRPYPFFHDNLKNHQGDFLKVNLLGGFDVIISLSVIEHFGFSSRYGGSDDLENDLDQLAFEKIAGLLKTEGQAIISVPYARQVVIGGWYRSYTREKIEQKLSRYFIFNEKKYYARNHQQWVEVDNSNDPKKTSDGVALFLLQKK